MVDSLFLSMHFLKNNLTAIDRYRESSFARIYMVAKQRNSMNSSIILLGTGTPNADPDCFGPSVALVVNQTVYLIDFGPGVVRRAAAAGIPVCKLNKAFLTHFHSDHTVGYPDLIFTPWVLGRREPLEVYGPPGIQEMTDHLLAAYYPDNDKEPPLHL